MSIAGSRWPSTLQLYNYVRCTFNMLIESANGRDFCLITSGRRGSSKVEKIVAVFGFLADARTADVQKNNEHCKQMRSRDILTAS